MLGSAAAMVDEFLLLPTLLCFLHWPRDSSYRKWLHGAPGCVREGGIGGWSHLLVPASSQGEIPRGLCEEQENLKGDPCLPLLSLAKPGMKPQIEQGRSSPGASPAPGLVGKSNSSGQVPPSCTQGENLLETGVRDSQGREGTYTEARGGWGGGQTATRVMESYLLQRLKKCP